MSFIPKTILIAFIIFSISAGCIYCAASKPASSPASKAKPAPITVGQYKRVFKSDYINDHSVVYDPVAKKWHMYGIHKGEKTFIHLSADSITQSSWERHEDFRLDGSSIWAPHIIRHAEKFWMYYTKIGVPRQIVLSTSKDLGSKSWTHYEKNPVIAKINEDRSNAKCKDPMIFKHGDQWIMYYSMVKHRKAGKDYWVVGYSTSKDLLNWSEPKIAFDEDKPNDPGVESPFVVKRDEFYYLFLSARPWHGGHHDGGVDVFRSKTPFAWNHKTDHVQRFSREETGAHAPEIIQAPDGKWYITRCGHGKTGLWIAPLKWNDELEEK